MKTEKHNATATATVRAGMMLAVAGFFCLSVGDTIVKQMEGHWPGTAVATLRYLFGWAVLTLFVGFTMGGRGFVCPRPAIQLLRGASVALATLGFFMGVQAMPLATATAIVFVSPAFTALLSALFLGEPARPSTWLAIALAFAGVLIVLQPEAARAGWMALYPLVAALGMSGVMLGNRAAAGMAAPLVLQWLMASFALPFLIVATLLGGWSGAPGLAVPWPETGVIVRCFLVAITGTAAHWLLYLATTRASPSVTAPMAYSQLIFAALFGWLIFGNRLEPMMILGSMLIIVAGLVIWHGQARAPSVVDWEG